MQFQLFRAPHNTPNLGSSNIGTGAVHCFRPGRQQLVTLCRYDRRRSANNYIERSQNERSKAKRGMLEPERFDTANDTIGTLRVRSWPCNRPSNAFMSEVLLM
jgi:hypothetical protein